MQLIQQRHAYRSWQLKLDLVFASVRLKISVNNYASRDK